VRGLVKVYADERERRSKVPQHLRAMGVTVVFRQLPLGDYIPAEGVIVERKRVDDLAHSVFEGRFFDQVRRLANSGMNPILVVEGDMRYLRNRYGNRAWAIEAALITASLYNKILMFYTENTYHTAKVIKYVAERLQSDRDQGQQVPTPATYRKNRKPGEEATPQQWQLYILSSFPGIGSKTADRLLRKFGSLEAVLSAPIPQLVALGGLSEQRARKLKEILGARYTGEG